MHWIKDDTTAPTRVEYLPPPELDGLVVKVVHDTEAGTWSIVYTEAGMGASTEVIESRMNA